MEALTISTPASRGSQERRAGRRCSRSRAARAASAGFTLIELMVVVVLISILAVIAAPALRVARDDRMAFDYARQIQQLAQRARARAAGRGAAQLVLAGPSGAGPSGSRGRITIWEALDDTTAVTGGPNPVSSCKIAGQWAVAQAYAGGVPTASNLTHLIAALELDTAGVNVDADITASYFIGNDMTTAIPTTAVVALAICYTPGGSVYASAGSTTAAAVTTMQTLSPFAGVADIQINRHGAVAGVPVGLTRHIYIPGSAAARILSK